MERLISRRSKRLALQVRVRVCGQCRARGALREETQTLSVNAHGTLVPLASRVELGQSLFLLNRMTGEEKECRVAYVGPVVDGRFKVGLEFRQPAPQFWLVDFPPVRPAAAEKPRARAASPFWRR
jgi:hypothetical protein